MDSGRDLMDGRLDVVYWGGGWVLGKIVFHLGPKVVPVGGIPVPYGAKTVL